MCYKLSKHGLRYEEEIRRLLLKYVSDHGKIIYIIHKSNLHLHWCGEFEPFKAKHEFQNSLPINHIQIVRMLQMIPRTKRKYLSEQFQVTGFCGDDKFGLL
jgi:hypothetical protein